jgi:HSP20 family molecular chaperone IbpA
MVISNKKSSLKKEKKQMTRTAYKSLLPSLFDPKIFDDLFTRDIEYSPLSTYPFNQYYDKERKETILEYALAGFSKDEISVTVEDNQLLISADSKAKFTDPEKIVTYNHGIAKRSMKVKWQFGNTQSTVDVKGIKTSFKDGLLRIVLPDKEKDVLTIPISID